MLGTFVGLCLDHTILGYETPIARPTVPRQLPSSACAKYVRSPLSTLLSVEDNVGDSSGDSGDSNLIKAGTLSILSQSTDASSLARYARSSPLIPIVVQSLRRDTLSTCPHSTIMRSMATRMSKMLRYPTCSQMLHQQPVIDPASFKQSSLC
jgi:hypothetical protein